MFPGKIYLKIAKLAKILRTKKKNILGIKQYDKIPGT